MGLLILLLILLAVVGVLNFGGVVVLGTFSALVNIAFYVIVALVVIALIRAIFFRGNSDVIVNQYDRYPI